MENRIINFMLVIQTIQQMNLFMSIHFMSSSVRPEYCVPIHQHKLKNILNTKYKI